MANNQKTNVHAHHRKRLKTRFLEYGFDQFNDHQILELLLFFAIPQADTNPIAHNLLNKFGTLSSVFEASYEELLTVEGIGDHSATLLKVLPALANVYNVASTKKEFKILNHESLTQYITTLFKGVHNEEFYVINVSPRNEILNCDKISSGDSETIDLTIREITNYVLKKKCGRIIVAHNHPKGSNKPSNPDIVTTHRLISSCVLNDVDVLDHIIYSPYDGCFSFRKSGMLNNLKTDIIKVLNYDANDARKNIIINLKPDKNTN